ncbi:MAG: tungsten cofactor oxidoreductase radical SAM maturase [Anaerolineae bacterium]
MAGTDPLNKLYVEITTACNLDCQMCVRRAWHEPIGTMPLATFASLMDQVRELPAPPIIHLGGYGEPMAHADFLEIVQLAKAAGARVEMTTNGTLLSERMAHALIDLDLDRLVVSFDAATAQLYADIREGSDFALVYENMRALYRIKIRRGSRFSNPQVGIAFVAMKSNIHELPSLPWLATRIGAWEVRVSNVVPHTPEMEAEILYERSLWAPAFRAGKQVADLSLPKLDINDLTVDPIRRTFNSTASISLLDASLSARDNYCRFVQGGYAVVRWDGEVSPCLSLLHDHPEYIRGRRKDVTHYSLGNITQQPLRSIWESGEYSAFRARLRVFPFSPCTTCGGCERFAGNFIDCSGEGFPTCGGCLWAQGFIQCP